MNEPRYKFRALWSDEDGTWVGACNGFLLVSHIAPTQAECLRGIRALVDDIVPDLLANGEPLPQPVPWDAFDAMQLDAAIGSAG
ncbi:MAG: hypothetical protein OXI97_05645 [Acidimicrobiaceae bacterium]|nr:hypothetical protein [Acidimicrobiaceae bacterium]